ncbi:type II secretion system F family protein [Zobellella maritima]|uniref:type II secretion system F family protein n=1 Tax=Zobellella maritima TaxID=2059725 RepID=UPI000E30676A|nr:type II secretion system F family protein [Zobellella maritima]
MNGLMEMFEASLADPQMRQWLLIGVVGLSAITLFWGLTLVAGGVRNPYRKQLKGIQEAEADQNTLEQRLVVAKHNNKGAFSGHRIRTLLVHAGFQKETAYHVFTGIRLLVVIAALVGSFLFLTRLSTLQFKFVLLLMVAIGYIAYVLPVFVVERLANNRMNKMKMAMPDALDLLVVCTEAGMGFKAALQRVAQEINLSHESLSEELTLVSAKLRAGLSMQQAFDEFILRTGLEDFRSLNVAINQSIQLGTSIAETLRVFADEYRIKRKQEAEELAAKIGTKLIFPLVTLIWPSFFIVAVGPALIKVFRVFGG